MQDFERLGAFYLGREFDLAQGSQKDDLLLYDSKDLTTHAVCVGMTGSGKTGLCVSLLEEAAIDGIPAIAIDPKGDLGNLLLTFPELRAEDFRPWVDEAEAARRGISADEFAARTAEAWRKGLAEWGQEPARIARFRSSVDAAIYTPGSSAGRSLTVLRSFAAPPPSLAADADALRERVMAAVSGLLALLKIEADPIRSREHILLSNLVDRAWRAGRDLELAGLIREIQSPPFERVGVLDIESFYPSKERQELSVSLNNLLASPSFGAWMEGEALDVSRLLWTAEGKPRLSVISIAHLGEAERMFFVTLLLNEIVAWMRTQSGTSSLRAIVYMDEIFGYFPPSANPPSKPPMLTLLKQARAFGLGVVLATQNPVDLDYKGLSNAGTWFLGRLQTERDKTRVLEGLERASAAAGMSFDRQTMEATLAGLGNRVFLMNNVHEDRPVVFQTRWALSYLRGPLTRTQIQSISVPATETPVSVPATVSISVAGTEIRRPVVPGEAREGFLVRRDRRTRPVGAPWSPALLGSARVHFVSAKHGVDIWEEATLLAPLTEGVEVWNGAEALEKDSFEIDASVPAGASFAPLPTGATRPRSWESWKRAFADHLYRTRTLKLHTAPSWKQISKPGESEGEFRARVTQRLREERDAKVEALRKRYAPRFASLEDRLRSAEQRVDREKSQFQHQTMQTAISVGATLLGALLGRKTVSAGTVERATTAGRGVERTMREKEDIATAKESVETVRQRMAELEREFAKEAAALDAPSSASEIPLETVEVRPRKADVSVGEVRLVWF